MLNKDVKKKRNKIIRSMFKKGKSAQEIAEYFNLSRQRIHAILKNA